MAFAFFATLFRRPVVVIFVSSVAASLALLVSGRSACASVETDVLTRLLSSASADPTMFADAISDKASMGQMNNTVASLNAEGGNFRYVDREGGALVAHYDKGDALFQLILTPQGRIAGINVMAFVLSSQIIKPVDDDMKIFAALRRLFNDTYVDLSMFADADLATKVANGRDDFVKPLGAFFGIYYSHGSYFARFDTMEIPIFVFMQEDGKIKTIHLFPPIPTKLVETGSP